MESTTYPGTTEEEIIPFIEELGYEIGKDFFVGYSPEREDPGNKKFSTKKKIYEKFPRIKFSDAMMKYGTDKPDLRNPLLINDITDIFKRSDVKFEIFKK